MSRIFAKTAKGKNEIATRENRLPQRARQILICVDSKKTVDDIRAMDLFPESELAEIMQMLIDEVFIEISLESEAQAALHKQQKELAIQELQANSEQNKQDAETAMKDQVKREKEEAKLREAHIKAALKEEKEEERRRERAAVSGWSSNLTNKNRY